MFVYKQNKLRFRLDTRCVWNKKTAHVQKNSLILEEVKLES